MVISVSISEWKDSDFSSGMFICEGIPVHSFGLCYTQIMPRCSLKKQEILVSTVGGITGMMEHLIIRNFLALWARKQALNSSPCNAYT